jgi:hypothetical protein
MVRRHSVRTVSEEQVPTVLERLVAMSISEERALAHLRSGFVRVRGEPVTDASLRTGAPIVICPPPVSEQQPTAG